MIVDVNCNILPLVKELIYRKRFGIRDEKAEDKISKSLAKYHLDLNNCDTLDCKTIGTSIPCIETEEGLIEVPVIPALECNGFTLDDITLSELGLTPKALKFGIVATGGTPPYTYNWGGPYYLFFEESIRVTNTDDSILILDYIGGPNVITITTIIMVTVTDSNNCSLTKVLPYTSDASDFDPEN